MLIKITIEGEGGTGKSTVASLLATELRKHNITVMNLDPDLSDIPTPEEDESNSETLLIYHAGKKFFM